MKDEEIQKELKRLFQTAKKFDEFQFVMVLIGYNGMGNQRVLTHLYESRDLIEDVKAMMLENQNKYSRTRLALLLYCHIFEMDDLYNIIGNLLRIATGQGLKYVSDLYSQRSQEELTPTDKIAQLKELAEQCRFEELINGINDLYINKIRNAFFHSSYSLVEDNFCIVKGEGIRIGNSIHSVLSIDNFLIPKIDSALDFIESFFHLLNESKLHYKENKLIQGRLPDPQPVIILGDPEKGLIGFQSAYGSGIKISSAYGTENFVEAMNIRFSYEPKEVTELSKKLVPYEEDMQPVGNGFEELKEEILKMRDKSLMRNLAVIYYNWANNTIKASAEKANKEKETLLNYALQRYNLSIQTDPTFGRTYNNKATTKLKLALLKSSLDNDVRWDAINEIEKGLQYEPLMFEANMNLGKLLSEVVNGEIEVDKKILLLKRSTECFNTAIDIYPKDDSTFEYRGQAYWELAKITKDAKHDIFSASIRDYKSAIDIKAELSYYLSLSTLLGSFAESDKEQAQSLYEQAVQVLKTAESIFGISSDTEYRIGNKYMMLAHLTGEDNYLKLASEAYENSIRLDSNNVKAWNNWGYSLLHTAGQEENINLSIALLKESIIKIDTSLKIESNHATAYYNLGTVYCEIWKRVEGQEKDGLLDKSIINLSRGESLKEGLCAYQLARVFALKGEANKSLFWLGKFLDKNSTEREIIINDKDFESLLNNQELETLLNNHFQKEKA